MAYVPGEGGTDPPRGYGVRWVFVFASIYGGGLFCCLLRLCVFDLRGARVAWRGFCVLSVWSRVLVGGIVFAFRHF